MNPETSIDRKAYVLDSNGFYTTSPSIPSQHGFGRVNKPPELQFFYLENRKLIAYSLLCFHFWFLACENGVEITSMMNMKITPK